MGLCPIPHKGLCPLTLQGELVPFDPPPFLFIIFNKVFFSLFSLTGTGKREKKKVKYYDIKIENCYSKVFSLFFSKK